MHPVEQPAATYRGGWGVAATALGVIGLLGFAWLWVITATPLDPPEWARIAGVWLIPLGVIGAAILGFLSLRGSGRTWAIVGLVLAALTVAGAVMLITLWPA
ncbi:hypothetical protein ACFC1W_09630 [Microbacterium sp. NPDC056003]|jgi:hypothetical protein|uniref:hypothetical protein n=1 Tax=Microbacterium sp. NPDC056003 TaxID=3345676 RepID=UPI0035D7E7A7